MWPIADSIWAHGLEGHDIRPPRPHDIRQRPLQIRAVGRVMATNPLPIVVPCHRVIGSDGSLRGYGAGLWMKEALLRAEGARG